MNDYYKASLKPCYWSSHIQFEAISTNIPLHFQAANPKLKVYSDPVTHGHNNNLQLFLFL